jgi:hypothetical protein
MKETLMSEILPYRYEQPIIPTRTSRAVGTVRHYFTVESAQVAANAEIQALKAEAIGSVARLALQEAAMISQLEQNLSTLVPFSASRLESIASSAAYGLAEVVIDTARGLR